MQFLRRDTVSQRFIKNIKNHAINASKNSGMLASVLAAQACLETGYGTSDLAKHANNLFGIKGTYNGQSYTKKTAEQKSNGQVYYVNAAFRKYPSYTESFKDRIVFFTSTPWRTEIYKPVTDAKSKGYKAQVTALHRSPYATDTQYDKKLLNIIEQYKLYEWDGVTVVKTHLIISGHGGNDPGAVGSGTNERDFTRDEVTPRIIKRINATPGHEAVEYNRARNMYVDTANGGGMYNYNSNSYDTMTELHLDAFNGTAEDGHVIIATGLLPDSIDKRLADAIDQYVGVRHGGINQRDNLLQVNVAKNRGINYRLVELGFIDNRAEMTAIRTYIDEYCNELADAITGGTGAAKAPVQAAVPKPQGVSQKGWSFAGTFVSDETIVVRRGYQSTGAPRLHLNEPVSEGSYIQPGDAVNFNHVWFADGLWWGRMKYMGRQDSTYYFIPFGERNPAVEFSNAKLWGELTSLSMKKGSKVLDWHKRDAIK